MTWFITSTISAAKSDTLHPQFDDPHTPGTAERAEPGRIVTETRRNPAHVHRRHGGS